MNALQNVLFTPSIWSFTPCYIIKFRASSFLRRLWWLRVRYESTNKIHPYCHLNHPSFWLVACNYIGNPNIDSSLSLKDRNLSLSWIRNGLHSCLCHYKQICPKFVTRHMKSLMLDIHYISASNLAPLLLDIHYLLSILNHLAWSIYLTLEWLSIWVTQHLLQLNIV